MKKSNSVKWLYTVTGRKKWNILCLMLVQAMNRASGVLYALILRNIVDNAVEGNKSGFWFNVMMILLLVLSQVIMRAVIRWLEELSRSSLENLFKLRLLNNILTKDSVRYIQENGSIALQMIPLSLPITALRYYRDLQE